MKDRPALRILQDAIADGRFTPDKTLIDATSGNTGVACQSSVRRSDTKSRS
ncbi:MAG: hypothetical protein R3A47_08285 [Polyangiales bacterium]